MKTKITLCLLFIALAANKMNAQYVTIADSTFSRWLQLHYPTCMNGNQMDTTCNAIVTETNLNCSYDSINNLDGIQYFVSLRSLTCARNRITYIPVFPDSLRYLDCTNNLLNSLPPFPIGLTQLYCGVNQIDSLPQLPLLLDTLVCSSNNFSQLPLLNNSISYLVCDNNHITSLPQLPVNLKKINCSANALSTLPLLPLSLTEIICSNNALTALPSLPDSLHYLNCSYNQLTQLPGNLITTVLEELYCGNNQLSTLPTLPSTLQIINCEYNGITQLPTLTNVLHKLICNNNLLNTFPVLPLSLTHLNCSANYFVVLPTLPANISFLNCSFNQLTTLPNLPNSLESIFCQNNAIGILPTLPTSLQAIDCGYNVLPILPALPSSLSNLVCSHNQLPQLPALPNNLNMLMCDNNLLHHLPNLPSVLSMLNCSNNQIDSLPMLSSNLYLLNCSSNLLFDLPLLPSNLTYLDCSNNQISCFPIFPYSMNNYGGIQLANNPFTCLPNYVAAMDSATLLLPLCIAGNVSGCPASTGIVGTCYLDVNTNCQLDTIEQGFYNLRMKATDSNGSFVAQTSTAINGIYNFPLSLGSYNVILDTVGVPFIPVCINPGIDTTVVTDTAHQLVEHIDFDLNCKPGFDVGVQSINWNGFVFPGQIHLLQIKAGDLSHWYGMNCAQGVGGTVKISIVGDVSFAGIISGALTPTIIGNNYTYNVSDFAAINNNFAFGLKLLVATTAQSGDAICVTVDVTPIMGDNDTLNNHSTYCYHIVNSYDPNMKETYPEEVLDYYNDYFVYTIHFQNTGTAPAIKIRLKDTLDTKLDWSTLQVIDYSHSNVLAQMGAYITFDFANIYLADSASNEAASKGYVQYRVKPIAGLIAPQQITNRAAIYFDFNAPVMTNISLNKYVRVINTNNIQVQTFDETISIFPNPSNGLIQIRSDSYKLENIKVYNLLGELINSHQRIGTSALNIDLSKEAKGIYFIRIEDENKNVSTKKIVVQ
jgi:Leucine-rich repeat (LRR) protein